MCLRSVFLLTYVASAIASEEYYLKCYGSPSAEELHGSKCALNYTSSVFIFDDTGDGFSTYNITLYSDVKNCEFNVVNVDIHVWTGGNESSCGARDNVEWKPHSSFSLDAYVHRQCRKMQMTLPVAYIVKGCYEITLSPCWQNRSTKISLQPLQVFEWIDNNYSTEDFHLKPSFNTLNSMGNIDVEWSFGRDISNLIHNVVIIMEESREDNLTQIYGCPAMDMSNSIDVTTNCTLYESKVRCVLSCIPFGRYSVILLFKENPHCSSEDSIFSESCAWTATFDRSWLPAKQVYDNETKTGHTTNMLMLLILLVIVIVGIVALWISHSQFRLKKNISWSERVASILAIREDPSEMEAINHCIDGIFLVYARDCQEFMDLMVVFRNVLTTAAGCKVYDLFDDQQFNEIAKSPHEWVQRLIEDKSIRIVIVATEIGEILHHRLIKHLSKGVEDGNYDPGYFLYRDVNFVDAYVLYAIKLISMNVNNVAPYQKYFVCRVPSMSKGSDYFTHINPYKRYDLPFSINALIENMTMESKITSDTSDEQSGDLEQKLTNALNALKTFVDNNPKYVKEITLTESDIL